MKVIKEITIRSVVRRCGGKAELRSFGQLAWDQFWQTTDKLTKEAFKKGYSEVIEPDPTAVIDYLDNL